jgi:hypothetical protein
MVAAVIASSLSADSFRRRSSCSVNPGAIALTVMFEGPSSLANARVRPITPAFAAM